MLQIQAFDKSTNKLIIYEDNEDDDLNEMINKIPILLSDSLKVIKEKVCIKSESNFPNFIKIEYSRGGEFYLLENDTQVSNISDYKIYVSNVFNVLFDKINDILLDSDNLFNQLKSDGWLLNETEYKMIINLIKYNNEMIQDNNEKDTIIQEFIEYSTNIKNKILEFYKNTSKDFKEFNKLSNIEYKEEYTKSINYTNLNIIIKGNDIDSKTAFIKLDKIFNYLELNHTIPLIALNKKFSNETTNEPLIKIYDRILDGNEELSLKDIKNWVLNENKGSTSYKTIKGLMLKIKTDYSNYLTMNLLPNGIIYVKYSSNDNDNESNLENIQKMIKTSVNNVILQLNKLNVFYSTGNVNIVKQERINTISSSTFIIDSIDIESITNFNIPLNQFKKIIQKDTFNDIFKYKETKSTEILSLYYREDKILNIRDYFDTSVINIFNVKNIRIYKIIMNCIYILNLISRNKDNDQLINEIKKIKEKSKKKLLKEQGINFDSRKCQHHPSIINNEGDQLTTDTILFDNKYYKCDDDIYKYPGFTINNILCCYTKPQLGTETYIRNVDADSLDILVQPSNFKVFIDGDFETYVIKMISNVTDENYTMYYYINRNNIIQPILNIELINAIKEKEQADNIWFDTVSLAQLIYPSATSKCNNVPDLTNRYNLNGPCDNNGDFKYFGYGANGIPCCFDETRVDNIKKNKKQLDITNTHKIQAYKPLKNLQIGNLSNELDNLLNNVLDNKGLFHYRIGVFQNNNSFLNCVLLGIKNDYHIEGVLNFKKFLTKYLNDNPDEFIKLGNGEIYLKYKSVKNYINNLNDPKKNILWNDFIDLLEKALNINIIILETIKDQNNKYQTQMVCRTTNTNKKFTQQPTLMLLKTKYDEDKYYSFELIIRINENASIKDKIITTFSYNNTTTKFLFEYYHKTCIKTNIYPDNYPFISLYTFTELKNLDIPIKYQVINSLNKTSLVMTDSGILLPIIEQGVIDNLEHILFKNITQKLVNLDQYINFFKKLKKEQNVVIKILGLLNSDNETVGGIMTNFGYIIPYLKTTSDDDNQDERFPHLDYTYHLVDIDSIVNNQQNAYSKYTNNKIKLNKDLNKIKNVLSNNIKSNERLKTFIEKLTIKTDVIRYTKIQKLLELFHRITNDIYQEDSYIKFLFSMIANDILNDTDNLFINGIIEDNQLEQRDTESVLLNIDDIYKWLKRNKNTID